MCVSLCWLQYFVERCPQHLSGCIAYHSLASASSLADLIIIDFLANFTEHAFLKANPLLRAYTRPYPHTHQVLRLKTLPLQDKEKTGANGSTKQQLMLEGAKAATSTRQTADREDKISGNACSDSASSKPHTNETSTSIPCEDKTIANSESSNWDSFSDDPCSSASSGRHQQEASTAAEENEDTQHTAAVEIPASSRSRENLEQFNGNNARHIEDKALRKQQNGQLHLTYEDARSTAQLMEDLLDDCTRMAKASENKVNYSKSRSNSN